ncbi:MAG: hypothetical protein ACRDO7_02100 [Nocardioidaceae bacterium]
MRRAGLAAAAAIMAVATLTACSGASAEEFCGLEDEYSNVDMMNDPDAAAEAMEEAVDKAPDEIKGDVETIKEATDALKDVDMEDPEAMAEATKDFDQAELEEASTNLQDWTKENCSE